MVITAISNVFVISGLTTSLIRTVDVDDEDYSTVFWYNSAAGIVLTVLLFIVAPWVADFYAVAQVKDILRVMSLGLIIGSLSAVQMAILSREMKFKRLAIIQVPSTLLAGIVAILLAFWGAGVWSLVCYILGSSLFKAIFLYVSSKWRPSTVFSVKKFQLHIRYGIPLLGSGLLDTLFREGNKLFVGKVFSTADLGHYVRAETFRDLPVNNISTTLSKVMFPYLSKKQGDKGNLKATYKKLMGVIVFLLVPVLLSLAFLSEEVFLLLFGPQWGFAAKLFSFLAIAGIFYPLIAQNTNLIGVVGRSDLVFTSEATRKVIFFLSFIVGYYYGLLAFVQIQIVVNILSWIIAAYFSGKVAKYGFVEQFKDYVIYFIVGGISLALTYILSQQLGFHLNPLFTVVVFGSFFFMVYLVLSRLLHLNPYVLLLSLVKEQIKR